MIGLLILLINVNMKMNFLNAGDNMVRISRKANLIKLSDEQIKQIVYFIEKQKDVVALFLFGSYGTKYQNYLSDVDFAILPSSLESVDTHKEVDFLTELQTLGRSDDINLINLFKVPVTLQRRILDEGRILFCRDEIALADFKEHVIRIYCDFEPDLKAFYPDYDAALREEFTGDC